MQNLRRMSHRGYALPVVIIASFIAATVTAAYLMKAKVSSESAGQLLRQRQTFYATDGMSRMVVKEVESYLMDTLDVTTLDLTNPENIPPPSLPGYTLEKYQILSDINPFDGPIPNGLFEGLHARQTPFEMSVFARHNKSGAASEVNLQVILGQIGLFQFFLFSDDYTELYPGPNMTIPEGRMHVNGDLCVASSATLKLDRITSSGLIRPGSEGCRRENNGAVHIFDGTEYKRLDWSNAPGCTDCGGTELNWSPYAVSTWKGHLRDRTHGVRPLRLPITTSPFVQAGKDAGSNLMLNNRNSRTLVDPVLLTDGEDVLEQKFAAQADIRILNGVWYVNDGTWPGEPIWSDHPGTFVVDPAQLLHDPLGLLPTWAFDGIDTGAVIEVVVEGDDDDDGETDEGDDDDDDEADEDDDDEADEGDDDDDGDADEGASASGAVSISGIPWGFWGPMPIGIGSDGPESWDLNSCVTSVPGNDDHGATYGLNLGCSGLPLGYIPPPAGSLLVGQGDLAAAKAWPSVPRRFSHYDWDPTQEDLVADGTGVISYGTLYRGSGPTWSPGFWGAGPGGATWTDALGIPQPYFCDQCNGGTCAEGRALRPASTPFCQGSEFAIYTHSLGAQYLQGARSGFIDQRIDSGENNKGKILPMNFDVAQFTAAMSDTTPGELGSYFNGGTTFNGLIYISSSWPGALDGLPNGLATLWPDQGNRIDAHQAPSWNAPMVQDALPHTLCSHTKGVIPNVQRVRHSGPEADINPLDGHETWFSIPSCDPVFNDLGHPNAVRIINADVVDESIFPQGLSITSNLPTYVLGETNTSSDPTTFAAEPWVPFMIGSDAMSLLSNNWDDANAPWDKSKSLSNRNAVNTQYNIEFIGGIVQTVNASKYSGGLENFPRFLENWSGKNATIRGSFVMGFNSVYARQRWGQGGVYSAPIRDWAFDPHLRVLNNQPPGTPKYSVHSISLMDRL